MPTIKRHDTKTLPSIMITNISIDNFKSLKKVDIELRNLNLLTGLNGSGKSSLIQVLLLLRQSKIKEYNVGYSLIKDKSLILEGTLTKVGCELPRHLRQFTLIDGLKTRLIGCNFEL